MWKNIVELGRTQMTGACAFHAGYLRLQTHTHRVCNTRCFSTATMVARTRSSVTLCVHRLSCFLSQALLYTLISATETKQLLLSEFVSVCVQYYMSLTCRVW